MLRQPHNSLCLAVRNARGRGMPAQNVGQGTDPLTFWCFFLHRPQYFLDSAVTSSQSSIANIFTYLLTYSLQESW